MKVREWLYLIFDQATSLMDRGNTVDSGSQAERCRLLWGCCSTFGIVARFGNLWGDRQNYWDTKSAEICLGTSAVNLMHLVARKP